MLVIAIASYYHCRMSEYVRLKNGLEVPQNTLLSNAHDIYRKFNGPLSSHRSVPDMLFRMVLTLQSGMSEPRLTDYEISLLELPMHDFHVGRLKKKNSRPAMARSALALNMIVVDDFDGDIEGYLDEPIGPHMPIMPILYQENSSKKRLQIDRIAV